MNNLCNRLPLFNISNADYFSHVARGFLSRMDAEAVLVTSSIALGIILGMGVLTLTVRFCCKRYYVSPALSGATKFQTSTAPATVAATATPPATTTAAYDSMHDHLSLVISESTLEIEVLEKRCVSPESVSNLEKYNSDCQIHLAAAQERHRVIVEKQKNTCQSLSYKLDIEKDHEKYWKTKLDNLDPAVISRLSPNEVQRRVSVARKRLEDAEKELRSMERLGYYHFQGNRSQRANRTDAVSI